MIILSQYLIDIERFLDRLPDVRAAFLSVPFDTRRHFAIHDWARGYETMASGQLLTTMKGKVTFAAPRSTGDQNNPTHFDYRPV